MSPPGEDQGKLKQEYEALTGTDALLTYLQDIEDGFDLPGYIERRYEGMRVNYML